MSISPGPVRIAVVLSIALGIAGCGGRPAVSADTGAKQAAERYFRAMIHRDWSAAYDVLDAASKGRVSQAEFARRAEVYLTGLKLNPSEATAGAAQEGETTATVHVAITGRGGHGFRRFKDTITLRKEGTDWKVELPRGFGRRGS